MFRLPTITLPTLLLIPLATVTGLLHVSTARATSLYVDASCGDDAQAGTSPYCAHANGPKLTIQGAINTAVDTDEIVVEPGTYNEVIDFTGKAITLRSTDPSDPAVVAATIIDGTGLNNSVVKCISGEGPDTVLDGFTITGGAGGLCFRSSTCGGGMYNILSDPTVTNCAFSGNTTNFGGGMYNDSSSPTLVGCTFDDNYVNWFGGGMCNEDSYPIIIDCAFWGNHAAGGGGAIQNWDGEVTVINSRFGGNSTIEFGGAMSNSSGAVNVINSTFSGNVAGIAGGAIDDSYAAATFLTNCAFTRNRSVYGGGLFVGSTIGTTVANCVFWGNVGAGLPGESAQINDGSSDGAHVANSCVQGLDLYAGSGNIGADPLFTAADGPDGIAGTEDDDMRLRPGSPCVDAGDNGRIAADIFDLDGDDDTTEPVPVDLLGGPRFVDDPCRDDIGVPDLGFPSLAVVDMGPHERPDDTADDPDGDGVINCDDNCPVHHNPGQEDCDGDGIGDLCVIAQCNGHPDCEDCDANGLPDGCDIADGHLTDADGNGRADQCQRPIYVDDNAQLGGDGTNWTTAFRFLQDAMAAARAGDDIRVAAGTYRPDQDEAGDVTLFDRTATFRLANERTLRGGYKGCPGGPCNLEEASRRDIATYEAVLSGDLGGNDGPGFENNDENSYHVVTASGTDVTAVLDGFTITRGYADSDYPNNDGAGMYTFEGSPTVSNCRFIRNSAESGGAMSNQYSSPTIVGCTFIRNTTLRHGGAIKNTWDGSPTVSRCIFIANSANEFLGTGGAISSARCAPVITDCLFIGNSARRGGAVEHGATVGAIVANCTFIANSAQSRGGAMRNQSHASPTVTNCILWGNSPDEIYNDDPTEDRPRVSYSNVQGGLGAGTIDRGGNIDADPVFVRVPDDGGDGWGDDPDTTEIDEGANDDYGDLRLQSGSLCISAGDPEFIPGPGETDLDGHARVLCGRVDMGAYEFGIGDYDCNDTVDLLDFSTWEACMTGPDAGPYGEGCEAFDFDGDTDVDMTDFALFVAGFEGS